MANERKCLVCGQIYQYCPVGCGNTNIFVEPWKYAFDTSDCNEIFNICCRVHDGKISNDEARKQLDKLNKPKTFVKNIQKNIDEIYGKVSEEMVRPKTEPILETPEPTEVQPSPITEEPKSEEVFTEVSEESKSEETPVE